MHSIINTLNFVLAVGGLAIAVSIACVILASPLALATYVERYHGRAVKAAVSPYLPRIRRARK